MEKYNDFALPSLENIEQMAKAFKDLDKKKSNLKSDESKNSNIYSNQVISQEQMQEFYSSTQKICAVADLLFAKYRQNEQVCEIFERCKKIKNQVDGMVLDYRVEELKDFAVAENTALQDFCTFCTRSLRVCVSNMHILDFKELTYEFFDLIELACKY